MQSKPKQYENIKRNESNTALASGVLPRTFSGLEWINLTALEVDHDFERIAEAENSVHLLSETLIYHFISAANSNQPNATVNLEFVNKLLRRGAKIDTADKHGQTLLHEVARIWHVDVATFLIERGASVNQSDHYGRTPLHVAASLNYIGMIELLLANNAENSQMAVLNITYGFNEIVCHMGDTLINGKSDKDHVKVVLTCFQGEGLILKNEANIEARTNGEWQTPFHYAAKYDATTSLQCLRSNGADINVLDYKRRTALHLAALHGRSEATILLLEFGCHADALDAHDQSCLNIILLKIPHLAHDALNQLHLIDHSNRIQFFYLKYLERNAHEEGRFGLKYYNNTVLGYQLGFYDQVSGNITISLKIKSIITLLELIVKYKISHILKHPVIQHYIDLKWNRYGFFGACIILLLKFIFIITWTILMIVVDWELRHVYILPKDWWRIVLSGLCIIELLVFTGVKLGNFLICKRRFAAWKMSEKQDILQDKMFCHPCWPSEATFIQKELNNLATIKSFHLDIGCLYDSSVIALLLVVIFIHVVDIKYYLNYNLSWLHLQIVAVTLPPLWLWNMKHFKPFKFIGPFVAMIGTIIPIIFKFMFIYIQFFIPYGFAYYLIFGGLNQLPEFNTISNCLFTMFRISIVDSYNYDAMYGRDALMTFILVGSFIALEAILAVNLLIAMLNCAFNRDNTVLQEKLYMARASILLYVEKYPYFSTKSDELYHYIKFIADPIVEPFYIEENTLEEDHNIKIAVFEIKRDLEELIQKIEKDEHNIFLQQLLKMYGEKEVMGNMSTRFSEERVSMILKNIINLQKAVTILHQQQDETYNRLKNSIEDLCERFEKELKYKPKKVYNTPSNFSDVEDRSMPLLKLIKRRLTHRFTQSHEDDVDHYTI